MYNDDKYTIDPTTTSLLKSSAVVVPCLSDDK